MNSSLNSGPSNDSSLRSLMVVAVATSAAAVVGGPLVVLMLTREIAFLASLGEKSGVVAHVLGSAPVERLTYAYVLAVGVGVLCLMIRPYLRIRLAEADFTSRVWPVGVAILSLVIVAALARNVLAVDARVVVVVPQFAPWAFSITSALALLPLLFARSSWPRELRGRVSQGIVTTLIVLVALIVLPSLIQINGGLTDVGDLPFYFTELGAVSGGRFPGWDFVSQYSTGLPYLFWLMAGLGRGSPETAIPVVVTCLNLAIVGMTYYAVRRLGASRTAAIGLALVFVGAWCFVSRNTDFGLPAYWAISPLRLLVLIPLLAAIITISRRSLGSRREIIVLSACYVAALLINSEWGLAVIAACTAVSLRFSRGPRSERLGRTLIPILIVAAIVSVVAIAQALFDAPVGPLNSLTFIRVAAVDGALQLNTLVPLGMEWPLCALFFVAITLGMWPRKSSDPESRVGQAAVLGIGIFGLLTTSYFFYRPLSATATALYPAWGLTGILVIVVMYKWVLPSIRLSDLVPAYVICLVAVLPVMALFYQTPPRSNLDRLLQSGTPESWYVRGSPEVTAAVEDVRDSLPSSAHKPIGVIAPFMAIDARRNRAEIGMPFSSSGYLANPRLGDIACRWLRGRFSALVVVPFADGAAEDVALRCAGYVRRGSAPTPESGIQIWAPVTAS